jgi:cysteine synthase
MIEETKKSDILIPEARTIIELAFGNASIRLNLASAVKGYHAIITLLEKIHQKR